jgi:uncharacterized protein YcaQ
MDKVSAYKEELLNTLIDKDKIFEYWAHAAAFYMRDYRFSLFRKNLLKINHGMHGAKRIKDYSACD